MSRHIIALQIFAGFVQEFARTDEILQTYLYYAKLDCVDADDFAIQRTEELIANLLF